jgi:hypothetical protein
MGRERMVQIGFQQAGSGNKFALNVMCEELLISAATDGVTREMERHDKDFEEAFNKTLDYLCQPKMLARLASFQEEHGKNYAAMAGQMRARNHLNRTQRVNTESLEETESQESVPEYLNPLQRLLWQENVAALDDCLRELSEADQEIFKNLLEPESFPKESPLRSSLSPEALKKRLYRARKQLKDCLERKGF